MTVRFPDHAEPVVVAHPEHGIFVSLTPGQAYDDNDPLVLAFPDRFVADGEAQEKPAPVESVAIEAATAAPGEKRARRTRQR